VEPPDSGKEYAGTESGEEDGGESKRGGGEPGALQAMYDKVTTQHDKIDDFRAKLLGFLPIVTGIGLFALAKDLPKDENLPSGMVELLPAIGLFGALASLGLFVHELRGITECYMLIELGRVLERRLAGAELAQEKEPPGAFAGRRSWGFSGLVSRETAALIVYPATIAAWVFVAGWPSFGLRSLALALLALLATATWGWYMLQGDAGRVREYMERVDGAAETNASDEASAPARSCRSRKGLS
jgi:hypothetical protein